MAKNDSLVPRQAASEIWVLDEHPGYRRAIENAETAAAPLPPAFSVTLLVLVVPTLSGSKTPVVVGGRVRVVEVSDPLSAVRELAAILLLLAGLLLVASVQAAINTRYYGHTPTS